MAVTREISRKQLKAAAEISKELHVEIEMRPDGAIIIRPHIPIEIQTGDGEVATLSEWLRMNE